MQPGQVVSGRFEIEREAGSGGMATVYRARDRETGLPIALKVLRAAEDAERFDREARMLADLEHEGIVRYVAHGSTPERLRWLAMEWVDGESLEHRLTRQRLSVDESVELARRVAAALGAAHAKGWVHRDLKPTNVLLEDGELDRPRIIDFGIALGGGRRQTTTGFVVGTAEYMAPEQARGDRAIDARADVFSLGCVLFDCLVGHPPFMGDQVAAVLAKVLFLEPPTLADLLEGVPEALSDLVARMLAKDPSLRPPDARAVYAELKSLIGKAEAGGRQTPAPRSKSIPPVALGGDELRHVSVVMLGEVGKTGGRRVGTDELKASLDPILMVVRAFDARAEKLVDGSVVVLLPVVGTATDQAARAATCALDLRDAAPFAPIAVATGRAEVGLGLPVGEAIDRAAGLLRRPVATAGAPIWIDDVTSGLLDERFVRGDQEGVGTLAGRRDVDTVRTVCGRPTPFVGREAQLTTLEGVFDECARESVARAVLVTGVPGVGKSRLRHELLLRLRSKLRRDRPAIWVARGEPVGSGAAFGLAAQAVRRAAGLREGEPLSVRQDKLRARVGENVGPRDRERLARFLGEMIGAPFADDGDPALRAARRDPILMGDQIRRAWEDLVGAECAAHPLVIMLEDLHWGDRPTVMLADSVLRLHPERPLMVLGFGRPEVDELFPDLWEERDVQRLRLGGLPRRAGTQLVRSIMGDSVAEDLVARMVETAAGNAFYLEELVRAQMEGRSGAELPSTVVAMVQSRLEALSPGARRVLRAASVFGQVFWEAGVAALLGQERRPAELGRWLDELVRGEVVLRRGEGRFAGQAELAFRHALVREGAYEMLTDEDRALGHRLAGEWLEEAGETEASTVAEHFVRGGAPARAVVLYRRAAGQALEGNDLEGALLMASRGASLGAEGEVLGALRLIQADAHRWRGEHVKAERSALEAMGLLSAGSDLWGDAARIAAHTGLALGHHESLAAIGSELCKHVVEPDAPTGCLQACASAADCLLVSGNYLLGERLLAAVEQIVAARPVEPGVRARLLGAQSTRALYAGSGKHFELILQSVALYDEACDARNACSAWVNVGFALAELGAYVEAEQALLESLALARRLGLENLVTLAQSNLGRVLGRLGRLDEAKRILTESLEASQRHGDRRLGGVTVAYLGEVLAQRGELEDAEHALSVAVSVLETAPPLRAEAMAMQAQLLLRTGRADEALAPARASMALLTSLGQLEEGEALVRLVHAEVMLATGDAEAASKALECARDRLLDRARGIEEPRWRKCFLEDVLEHARTLQLAGRSVLAAPDM